MASISIIKLIIFAIFSGVFARMSYISTGDASGFYGIVSLVCLIVVGCIGL